MSNREEMKELIKKRGSYKGRLTVFSTYLNSLSKSLSQSEVCELQLRVNKLDLIFSQYDEVQLRIECLTDDAESQIVERSEFETSYYQLIAKAQELLSRNSKNEDFESVRSSSRASNHKLVKLPTIKLPTFSGSYENWLEFHDTFYSIIHSNDDIDDINKFHYLRASLEGTAALVIQSIEFSSKNYNIAWTLLCERFDNKRLLIQNHVSAIFNIQSSTKESSVSVKHIIDELNKNLRSLESLGEPTKHWDTLLIYIVTRKLDVKTYREWEECKSKFDKDSPITLSKFLTFMQDRADLLETLERNSNQTNNNKNIKARSLVSVTSTQQQIKSQSETRSKNTEKPCPKCNGEHSLQNCSQFLALSNEQRYELLPNIKVCFNCLKPGHYANRCKKNGCKVCNRKHNTLVHVADLKSSASQPIDGAASATNAAASANQASANVTLSCVSTAPSHSVHSANSHDAVLLSTALIKLYDNNNRQHIARALLDSGSTSCLITDKLCSKLNLPFDTVNKSVIGINNAQSHINKTINVQMKSLDDTYSRRLRCFVLPSITDCVPSQHINISTLNMPADIILADPNFYTPSTVDLIIGADIFWDLLGSRNIKLGDGKPTLYETSLGWIVSGPISSLKLNSSRHIMCNFTNVNPHRSESLNDDIQMQLTRFWQLEEVSPKSSYYSEEEQLCENHFCENTTRLQNGRFCVRIPLKKSQDLLGDSFQRARHCLLALERRTKPHMYKSYCDFMSEYLSLGHMSECTLSPQSVAYFIPHHGVLRECSSTTKLRVVFNASSPTSSGVSLNNLQMVGPTIQDDLLSILIRFRQHKYILAADIEKFYRQVIVHPSDRHLQQILWRDNPSNSLKVYQLNTVTYGTASAPFLAVRCLKQLGMECEDPKMAEVITHDFYVDDLLTGGSSIDDIINIKNKVTAILESACIPLRKFKSNSSQLMSDSQSSLNLNIGSKEPSKTLGLGWNSENDELCFSINIETSNNHTKRSILSAIAQIFDPMGLLSPCVILMKILLQKLWLLKLSWDDDLPTEIVTLWYNIIKGLPSLNYIRIPRMVICDSHSYVDLHIFSDASQNAYGACVYVRSVSNSEQVLVRLLLAKSRVAPIKPTTIPRLELCGALVGVSLYEKVINSLRLKIRHTTFWTDSMIVLSWLKILPSKLQPFVRNRVADILEKTGSCTWRHAPTDKNPADLISRGVDPNLIQSSELWWFGPKYLTYNESHWPLTPGTVEKLPELKPEVSSFVATDRKTDLINFNNFSSFLCLKRTVAYVLRFIALRCKKVKINTEHLSCEELQAALNVLVRLSQADSFHVEYKLLLEGKPLPKKSPLIKFNPFLDDHNLMRVGGRLINSDFPYEKKHPLIIQSTHTFTKLLFQFEHKKLMHAGPQLLLATIKENYWPIGGLNLAKLCCRQCVLCNRMKGKTVAPIMGNLPSRRLSPSHPFETVGIDYAGPILAANRQGRGCRLSKVYIAIFICFTTKAIHTELVGDLTSSTFLSALRRFMSRRGKPKNIYSDNGTSFVGACNDISKFLKSNCSSLSESSANEGITFHFTPPYSPHFGGLWEAGVKSIKYHLRRVLGNCNFTYEELNTVLVQIEALLNSRPLSPMSSDPDDLMPLTPAHFLIGRPLTSLPAPNYETESISRLTRYQRIESLRQHFWKRWSKEFIAELQTRAKWRSGAGQLNPDTLVILKDDNLPPLKWKMGRIVAVHPGPDGVNRVADVRTANGTVRRAFSKICPLHPE